VWQKEQGLLSVKDLWLQGTRLYGKEEKENFVERADLLNR